MRKPTGVFDTSCLIALDLLELLPQLTFLFSQVLIPKAVRDELFRRRSTKDRVRVLFREYAFFIPCDRYDRVTVDLLSIEYELQGRRDLGEIEAIVQANEHKATVIIDDQWGRRLAHRFSLECHGTLWLLQQLHTLKLLSGQALRLGFETLRRERIRLPWQLVNDLLKEIGEQGLDPLS